MSDVLVSDTAEITTRLGAKADAFAGKTIVLTGARGFLGRYFTAFFGHLNDHVLERPCRVLALDNLITGAAAPAPSEAPTGCEFVDHDVVQPFRCAESVDYVIHA